MYSPSSVRLGGTPEPAPAPLVGGSGPCLYAGSAGTVVRRGAFASEPPNGTPGVTDPPLRRGDPGLPFEREERERPSPIADFGISQESPSGRRQDLNNLEFYSETQFVAPTQSLSDDTRSKSFSGLDRKSGVWDQPLEPPPVSPQRYVCRNNDFQGPPIGLGAYEPPIAFSRSSSFSSVYSISRSPVKSFSAKTQDSFTGSEVSTGSPRFNRLSAAEADVRRRCMVSIEQSCAGYTIPCHRPGVYEYGRSPVYTMASAQHPSGLPTPCPAPVSVAVNGETFPGCGVMPASTVEGREPPPQPLLPETHLNHQCGRFADRCIGLLEELIRKVDSLVDQGTPPRLSSGPRRRRTRKLSVRAGNERWQSSKGTASRRTAGTPAAVGSSFSGGNSQSSNPPPLMSVVSGRLPDGREAHEPREVSGGATRDLIKGHPKGRLILPNRPEYIGGNLKGRNDFVPWRERRPIYSSSDPASRNKHTGEGYRGARCSHRRRPREPLTGANQVALGNKSFSHMEPPTSPKSGSNKFTDEWRLYGAGLLKSSRS